MQAGHMHMNLQRQLLRVSDAEALSHVGLHHVAARKEGTASVITLLEGRNVFAASRQERKFCQHEIKSL